MENLLNISIGCLQVVALAFLCLLLWNQSQRQVQTDVTSRIDNLLTYTEERHNRLSESVDNRANSLEQRIRILEARQEAWRSK
ncbi:hypothetical protein D9M68_708990 [compost metagenome]